MVHILNPATNSKDYWSQYGVFSVLQSLADKLHPPLLLLHHTNSRSEDDLPDVFDQILGELDSKARSVLCCY